MTLEHINNTLQSLLVNTRSTGETYRMYLLTLFKTYYDMLEMSKFDIERYCFIASPYEDVLENVKMYCDQLLEIYDLYMGGKIGQAVELMRDRFTSKESMFTDNISSTIRMYRARVQDSQCMTFNVKDMFHVPFETRGKIANNRFSITGYPCLYLGKSILACWEEMHKPMLDNLSVSRFLLKKGIQKNIINLCWHSTTMYDLDTNDEDEQNLRKLRALRLLQRYPLMIACSIRTFDPKAPFKEEYVIPQVLLLSCIDNEYVDGISYTSTRRDNQIADDIELHQNFVFPAQDIKDIGFCSKLASDFQMTRGISFMEADINNVFYGKGTPNIYVKDSTLFLDKLDHGKTEYQRSKFGQMEEYLGSLPLYELWKRYSSWQEHPTETPPKS